jgi:hypothetical protein
MDDGGRYDKPLQRDILSSLSWKLTIYYVV